jgi:hypothetical protein
MPTPTAKESPTTRIEVQASQGSTALSGLVHFLWRALRDSFFEDGMWGLYFFLLTRAFFCFLEFARLCSLLTEVDLSSDFATTTNPDRSFSAPEDTFVKLAESAAPSDRDAMALAVHVTRQGDEKIEKQKIKRKTVNAGRNLLASEDMKIHLYFIYIER